MPRLLSVASQVAVMAAIVTTLLWLPAGALVAGICYLATDISIYSLVTFGDRLGEVAGALAWWGIVFVPCCIYTAFVVVSQLEAGEGFRVDKPLR